MEISDREELDNNLSKRYIPNKPRVPMTEQLGLDSLSLGTKEAYEELILNKTSSLSLHDDISDEDLEMEEASTPSRPNHFLRTSILKHEYTPRHSSPLKEAYIANNDNVELLDDEDEEMIEAGEIEAEDSFSKHFTKASSLILSPTILGAKLATHRSPILDFSSPSSPSAITSPQIVNFLDEESETSGLESPSVNTIKNRNKPKASSALTKYVTTDEDTTYDATDITESSTNSTPSTPSHYQTPMVKTPWGNAPIQFQMHHHHYYPPSPSTYDTENDDSVILPSPWSKSAEPKAPTPYLISSYLQLIFNAITSSIAIYILMSAIKTVKSDINLKMEEYASQIAMEVSQCTRSYLENKCAPETRVSALESLCIEWERCMNRDPLQQASKASVSAETLGMILNSLIEPIGAKAIVVFTLGFVAWAFTSNFIFGFVRAKSYYGWNHHEQQPQVRYQQQGLLNWQAQQTPHALQAPHPPKTPGTFTNPPSGLAYYEASTPS